MVSLANWLTSIGLGQYAEVFRANDIDPDILTERDEADLDLPYDRRMAGSI